jgi:pyruvate/2-oxoglutarate dehydrogenase complex dihydrolipoamide acyltransferase (E2) component
VLSDLGTGVSEVTIGGWLKQVGDVVQAGDPLLEVVTDKVNAEMPSPFAGVLSELLVAAGETVSVGAEVALIDSSGASAVPDNPSAETANERIIAEPEPVGPDLRRAANDASVIPAETPPFASPPTAQSQPQGRLSPAVRRLLRERGIGAGLIAGTGPMGRITQDDVLAASPSHGDGGGNAMAGTPIGTAIAPSMPRSVFLPASASTTYEVDMTRLMAHHEAVESSYLARYGTQLLLEPFVVKATVQALVKHPQMNARWTEHGPTVQQQINVGIAVGGVHGRLVAVIHDADRLSISGLNRTIQNLTDRAGHNRLDATDLEGATIAVINTGPFGSVATQPLLDNPQVGIVSTDAIVRRPVVIDTSPGEAIAVRSMMNLRIGVDGRADESRVGRFAAEIKARLESVEAQHPLD